MVFIIPGELIAFLTFPGVIIHEIAHRFFCDMYKVKVFAANYFNIGSKTAGYVIHENTTNHSGTATFLIATGPLWINSILGSLILLPNMLIENTPYDLPYYTSSVMTNFIFTVNSWIGYSILFHAIPSQKDLDVKGHIKQFPLPLKIIYCFLRPIAFLCNMDYVGFFITIGYVWIISHLFSGLYTSVML
ncbi:DUF3267 domain-containing protein [Candidatus Babeliales bacterium]|nr:DUF3267 domain-containing protein [Candidatus Babeliales bacterium]